MICNNIIGMLTKSTRNRIHDSECKITTFFAIMQIIVHTITDALLPQYQMFAKLICTQFTDHSLVMDKK